MKFRCTAIALVVSTALTAAPSFAQLPSLPNSSSSSTTGSDAQLDQLVKAYVAADKDTLQGQSKLAQALGLKEESAKLDAEVKALSSATAVSSDDLKKADAVINDAQPQINAKVKERRALSAGIRKKYTDGLASLGNGVQGTYKLNDSALAVQKGAQTQLSKSPTQQGIDAKLGAGSYVAAQLPVHLKLVAGGLQTSVTYAHAHCITVPKSATDVLHHSAMASN